jgi:hypothetical protein
MAKGIEPTNYITNDREDQMRFERTSLRRGAAGGGLLIGVALAGMFQDIWCRSSAGSGFSWPVKRDIASTLSQVTTNAAAPDPGNAGMFRVVGHAHLSQGSVHSIQRIAR